MIKETRALAKDASGVVRKAILEGLEDVSYVFDEEPIEGNYSLNDVGRMVTEQIIHEQLDDAHFYVVSRPVSIITSEGIETHLRFEMYEVAQFYRPEMRSLTLRFIEKVRTFNAISLGGFSEKTFEFDGIDEGVYDSKSLEVIASISSYLLGRERLFFSYEVQRDVRGYYYLQVSIIEEKHMKNEVQIPTPAVLEAKIKEKNSHLFAEVKKGLVNTLEETYEGPTKTMEYYHTAELHQNERMFRQVSIDLENEFRSLGWYLKYKWESKEEGMNEKSHGMLYRITKRVYRDD